MVVCRKCAAWFHVGVGFHLTPHEVMRGLKVRDGALVLRPSGMLLFNNGLDVVFGGFFAVAAVLAGGAWLIVIAVYMAAIAVSGILRLRVAVIADSEAVTVRGRWRTERIPVDKIATVRVDMVHWTFRQPAYTFHGWWPGGYDWEIGVLKTTDGRRVECDALISAPAGENDRDPTPARMKIDALRRWLVEVSDRP